MKVGISSLYLITKPFRSLVQKIPKLNTRFIEIVDDGLHSLNKKRAETLKELAETYELEYSVHAPFADINPTVFNQSIRKAMIKRLGKSLNHASLIKAKVWVFHPGARTGLSYFYPKQEWRNNIKFVKRLLKVANDVGVKIAVENLPPPYPLYLKTVEDFTEFYREAPSEIRITLDIGHANLNDQIELFLDSFADMIVHMHASDNNGRDDQHLGVGDGTVNWQKICRKIKEKHFKGSIVVESIYKAEESLEKLKKLMF